VLAVVLFGGLALAGVPESAAAGGGHPVRVQLKWSHQFQFAGFYAALEKGWFREAGLDVTLLAGGPDIDPADVVARGGAEFGVGNSSLVIDFAEGRPLMAVAAIFQHSPLVILARREPGLEHVFDLPGWTMMVETHCAELLAYLKLERVPVDRIRIVPHAGDVRPLIDGRVAATTAYTTTEPYLLIKERFPFQVFNPRSSGIDFYGDTLFTTRMLAARDRAMVQTMREVVIRGWRYALEHPAELVELILGKYAPELDRGRLEFEAEEIRRLMLSRVVDIGYMSVARWRHIADSFAAAGLISPETDLSEFLFDPDVRADLRWLYGLVAGMAALLLFLLMIAHRFHRLNYRLRQEMAVRAELEAELMRQARTDPLTGIANRRDFLVRAAEELLRSHRFNHPVSLLMIDIDHFKQINDSWGHPVGDRVLVAMVGACLGALAQADLLSRVGGEEFTALLPETGRGGARITADALRRAVERLEVPQEGGRPPIRFSISIGIAVSEDGGEPLEALLARGDQALYAAKRAGRNRVMVWEEVAGAPPAPAPVSVALAAGAVEAVPAG
jgi:diguanylate cyclase (GGDEF)-like protein